VGIFDRLGDVIKSYLYDEDGRILPRPSGRNADPDLEEAEAELENFLRGGERRAWGNGNPAGPGSRGPGRGSGAGAGTAGTGPGAGWGRGAAGGRGPGTGTGPGARTGGGGPARPPEELRRDFAELGIPFGAGAEACKAAYKRLLKLHHPDRHAGHEGNMRKATEKSARINAAYDRIEKWRRGNR
jgi:DnaJ-domain-containing protein 1